MATITWGGASGDWATAADWVGGVAPAALDSAQINGTAACTIMVDAPESIVGVTLSDKNAVLTIQAGGMLTLGGVMALSAGQLDVASGGAIAGLAGALGTKGSAGGAGQGSISLGAKTTLTNAGAITGGAGGQGSGSNSGNGAAGGAGAASVTVTAGWLVNTGVIQGGAGGHGGDAGRNNRAHTGPSGGAGGAGGLGVQLASGFLSNAGTILGGAGGVGGQGGFGYYYIGVGGGGGSGGTAVSLLSGSLVNSGDIQGGSSGGATSSGYGVDVAEGSLTNKGSIVGGAGGGGQFEPTGPGGAGVQGGAGVFLASGQVTNSRTILGGAGGAGAAGGAVYDGEGTSTGFSGGSGGVGGAGVMIVSGSAANSGEILGGIGGAGGSGRYGADGGSGGVGGAGVVIVSGSASNSGEILGGVGGAGGSSSYGGLTRPPGAGGAGGAGMVMGSGSVTNSGTILGGAGGGSYALAGSGIVVSGASVILNKASGEISGYVGVSDSGSGGLTLTNYGTVVGTGGTSVSFANASDRLIAETGSVFEGVAAGGGGTLELATGTGTISGLGGGGKVSGAEALSFSGFGAYAIDGGAWTLTGTNALASTQTLAIGQGVKISGAVAGGGGTLELAGGAGTITGLGGAGTISGPEALSFSGFGAYVIDAGGSWTLAGANALGSSQRLTIAGDLAVNASLSLAGNLTQTGGTMSLAAADTLTLTGAVNSLAGTVAGAGTLAFHGAGGTVTLTGTSLLEAMTVISGPTVNLAGTVTMIHLAQVTTANMIVGAGGATLTGAGTFTFGDVSGNRIYGATAGATFTNDDRIKIAGQIGVGKMALINNGIIDDLYSHGLVIDTGASTILNTGVIECFGTGGVTVKSAVDNTGTLGVYAGVLTVQGAVSGGGKVRIEGGTMHFSSDFSENVTFAGAGELELAKSRTYAGKIAGFSTTGTDVLDLRDIVYASTTTTASYAGTKTSGVLTVTDGHHTAKIRFVGDYLTSKWILASDGHNGTTVVDPVAAPAAGASSGSSAHSFIAAAAGLGASQAGSSVQASPVQPDAQTLLAAPHTLSA